MKSTLIFLLIICCFVLSIFGCSSNSITVETANDIEKATNLDAAEWLKKYKDSHGNDTTPISEEDTTETEPTIPEKILLEQLNVYYGFTVVDIGPFHNGIARYEIIPSEVLKDDIIYEDGKFGYVDSQGYVKILPIYSNAPELFENPAFVNYNKNGGSYSSWLTEFGFSDYNFNWEFKFEDNMEKYGTSSNGLFWVLSCDKQLSGNVYTMTYYDTDGKEVFSLNDAQPVDFNNPYDNDSNFNDYGYALVEINNVGHIIDKKGTTQHFKYDGNLSVDFEEYFIEESFYKTNSESNVTFEVVDFNNLDNHNAHATIAFDYIRLSDNYHNVEDLGCEIYINYTTQKFKIVRNIKNLLVNGRPDYSVSICGNAYEYDYKYKLYDQNHTLIVDWLNYSHFEGATFSKLNCSPEGYITFSLKNPNSVYFAAIADCNGKLTMNPTTSIDISSTTIQEGLCVAKDTSTGLYGYIDTTGTWVIKPKFNNAESFSDGLALVNNSMVIDKSGNTVFYLN